MKITLTLDSENPSMPHAERQSNVDFLESIKGEPYCTAAVGALILVSNVMSHAEFKQFVEWSQAAYRNRVTAVELSKMN